MKQVFNCSMNSVPAPTTLALTWPLGHKNMLNHMSKKMTTGQRSKAVADLQSLASPSRFLFSPVLNVNCKIPFTNQSESIYDLENGRSLCCLFKTVLSWEDFLAKVYRHSRNISSRLQWCIDAQDYKDFQVFERLIRFVSTKSHYFLDRPCEGRNIHYPHVPSLNVQNTWTETNISKTKIINVIQPAEDK